ncbi:MAG: helicase, partial [Sulfurimonas sp.]|nr:helicase [Sulfurimonas sp.]
MSKKNKKNSKINQKIRKYFDDDPFDVGIDRVSSETLSELFSTLGIYDIEHTKDVLVKTVRMLWSEADSGFRSDILNFFESNGEIYSSNVPKMPNIDREQKIDILLEELDVSHEEAVLLHEAFHDIRSKKITIEKIESKLHHIRYEMKKERLQKELDGIFDIDDTLEFNASIHYILYSQSFHKILTLNTKVYNYEYLQDGDEDEIIEKISDDKESVIARKQDETNRFIKNLADPHKHLTHKEIVLSLRASPPKTRVSYPIIKESVLSQIIQKELGEVELELHDEELMVRLEQNFVLPHSNRIQSYSLEVHVELNSLLQDIWESKELDFSGVISEAKKEYEEQFLNDLSALVEECRTYATLLHLSDEELHMKVYEVLLDLMPYSLVVTPKILRKTVRRFVQNTHSEVIIKQRHALL